MCLRGRVTSGAVAAWEFERGGETVRVDPSGPLIVRIGAATDLAVDAALAGTGIIRSIGRHGHNSLHPGAAVSTDQKPRHFRLQRPIFAQ